MAQARLAEIDLPDFGMPEAMPVIPATTYQARLEALRARADVRGYDRFEGEQVDFHRRVREGFLAIARAEPARVTVIESTRELAVVSTDILIAVERLVGH